MTTRLRRPGPFEVSRRSVLRLAGGLGTAMCVTLVHRSLAVAATPPGSADAPGTARQRIEGLPKVTGQKIYARDFRAADMPGWPAPERVALVLRATEITRLLGRIDLSMLPAAAQPLTVVTGRRLAQDRVGRAAPFTSPVAWPAGLLAAEGERPIYYGQPVAILIFDGIAAWRRAKPILQGADPVRYGAEAAVPAAQPYAQTTHITRVAGPEGDAFSQMREGKTNPFASSPVPADSQARLFRDQVGAAFDTQGLQVIEGAYTTQVLDPMFMEPEAGLGWFDQESLTLHLVLGTQSTNDDLAGTAELFADPACPFQPRTIELNACYPGGGFGGRDTSAFPPLLALAAAYAAPFGNRPVRLAQDRFEQFQSGLKQLGSHIRQRIAVDSGGRLVALQSRMELDAGGFSNDSPFVAQLAAYCSGGGYRIDKVAIDAEARPTPGVIGGSMRGFGGPQACFALESLMDEAAQALQRDPIAFRAANVLQPGDRTVTGALPAQTLQLQEICRRAAASPLWSGREAEQARSPAGTLYGVGFALANQAFGTGTDGTMAEVEMQPDGTFAVRSNAIDMGTGTATTLSIAIAGHLGANAAVAGMGEAERFVAPLGFDLSLKPRPPRWDDPRWTAKFSMTTSACLTAFHQVHAVQQAALVLFEAGLLPAAARLWGVPVTDLRGRTSWTEAGLMSKGRPPLPHRALARSLGEAGLPTAAMAHALFQSQWVTAEFTIDGWMARLPLDGLATRPAGQTAWRTHPRQNTAAPPDHAYLNGRSLFSPSGALAAVTVDKANGAVRVVAMETILDAGQVLHRDLLEGQWQGGVAMGIGYALLEELPPLVGGAGQGGWNLDRYQVARMADMPLDRMTLTVLPSPDTAARGIAEAVLCPVPPAIANAIAHATGHRFRDLPITPQKIKAALA